MNRLAALIVFVLAGSLAADIITLNDGTRLDGEIKRTANGYAVTDAAGRTTQIAAADIRSIELKRATPPSTRPAAPPTLQTVQKPINAKGDAGTAQIIPLIGAKKWAEASTPLDKALADSPGNPDLLYLKGIVLFRQNRLVPARNAFESVKGSAPDHAPTHNNLAVILYQTHALMPALLEYDKAMQADPLNQQVLDNVAEALHALPASYASNALAKKVAGHFGDQMAQLEQKMASQGLRRYGSQWINEDDFSKIQTAQRTAQDKIESYQNDAMTLQTQLTNLDRDITDKKRAMQGMEQEQSYVDVYSGQVVSQPLPPRYYQLRDEIARLSAEKVLKQRQLAQLPGTVADAQQKATARQAFTGKQQIFDERFMPTAPAATQPATRAAQ